MHSESAADTKAPAAGAPHDDGDATLFAQLEAYARDVRLLHGQRATLADEVRTSERKLAAADRSRAALYERLEQEHERARSLLAARQQGSAFTGLAPEAARSDRSVL